MPQRHRLALVIALSLPLAACGDDGQTPAADAGDPDAPPAALLEPPPDGEGLQLVMDAPVASGEETTQCLYLVLPGTSADAPSGEINVERFEHRYSEGSHHLLLFPTALTPAEIPTTELFECENAGFGELGVTGIAYAAQVPSDEVGYPPGVAWPFRGGDVVLIQAHYLNTSEVALDAHIRINLWESTVPVTAQAGTLFFYNYAILVPAGGTAGVDMRCEIPSNITMLNAMSHMHRRGVGYTSRLVGGALAEPVPLYQTTNWEDVALTPFEPAIDVTPGQAIEFHCDFQNDGMEPILEGPSATANEMCMYIASYYPKVDILTELCANPGSGPVYHGDKTCAETVTCAQNATTDLASEQCLLDTCEASSRPLGDFYGCVFNVCAPAGCPDGPECNNCILSSCIDQFNACQAATCIPSG